jgi:signal transduction histidine kinase
MEVSCAHTKSSAASITRRRLPGNSGKAAAKRTSPQIRLDHGSDERERLRSALHGGLGQLLTSISFLASSLRHKLAARKLPEADEAAEILSLTGRAISETQAIVRDD